MSMGFVDKPQPDTRAQVKTSSSHEPSIVTYETITLDDSTETDFTESSQLDLCSGRKRRRTLSLNDDSFENPSPSPSPEIRYAGSPAIYKLQEQEGRVFIVKVPMSSKPRTRRSQKCSDQDITQMLDSDNDDDELTIFDPVVKIGARVDATPRNLTPFKQLRQTPERMNRSPAYRSRDNSPDAVDSKSDKRSKDEVSLKIKLRRSTEQSNYKIAVDNVDKTPRRKSSRSSAGTPKRCKLGDCNEDHDSPTKNHRSPAKTPKTRNAVKKSVATPLPSPRRTRRSSRASSECSSDGSDVKNLHNKENNSKANNNDNDDENDNIDSPKRFTRSKSRSATPQKIVQKTDENVVNTPKKIAEKLAKVTTPRRGYLDTADIINVLNPKDEGIGTRLRVTTRRSVTPQKAITNTPSSTRSRRNSIRHNYNENNLSDVDELDDNCTNVVDTPRARVARRSSVTGQTAATPQKQRKIVNEPTTPLRTPRKSSTRQLLEETATPKRTPRKSVLQKLEEPQTPRKSAVNEKIEEIGTPKRTPRKSVVNEKIEEIGTPKRTPRKSVAEKIEEIGTPKRTPRKSVADKMEEIGTPKRTPRKSVADKMEEMTTPKRKTQRPATIEEVDEPTTPSTGRRNVKIGTPSIKLGNLTPSMTRRTANVGKPKTILEEARAQLHVSTVPKSLPCRDDEFNNIFTFLESKLLDKSSGCIYVSGVPGTGKTATVTEAIRALKRCVAKVELDDFDFIEINGMKLSEPRQAYVRILKQMTGQTATWEQAHGILDKRFTKSNAKRQMTLLLVDELDLLCNKRQDVVYNLLDWPSKQNSHLVVITIANTMDLPERVLMSRVTSRLGLTRITFQPYTFKQLQEIVEARLKDSVAFKSEAIQLVARKVAAVSGDARRALDICRRATEITEFKSEKIVTMMHVNEALQEMISSAKVKAIKLCSEMEKFFLRAVDAEVTRTGVEEVVFHNIYRQLTTICSFEGVKTPNVTLSLLICSRLSAYRLLLSEQTKNDLDRRIILNVSSDDIHFAMQTFENS